ASRPARAPVGFPVASRATTSPSDAVALEAAVEPFGPADGDVFALDVTGPPGCWWLPIARLQFNMDALMAHFGGASAVAATPSAFIAFCTDWAALVPPTFVPPWISNPSIPADQVDPNAPYHAEDAVALFNAWSSVDAVLPPTHIDDGKQILLAPAAVAQVLFPAFVAPYDDARDYMQMILDGAPTGGVYPSAGASRWQFRDYPTWPAVAPYLGWQAFMNEVLATAVDVGDESLVPENVDWDNKVWFSKSRWAWACISQMFTGKTMLDLATELVDAWNQHNPEPLEAGDVMPLQLCLQPVGICDPQMGDTAYPLGGFGASAISTVAVLPSIPSSSEPRIRFGNPVCITYNLRLPSGVQSLTNGASETPTAVAGGDFTATMGGLLAPGWYVKLRCSTGTWVVDLLPGAVPGEVRCALPSAITQGTVVEIREVGTACGAVSGVGRPWRYVTAQ
ncbi:MAG TPA: hypothetical protein VEI02_07220, partial [Planctomycetota bacterium]|nr:hypothetical protein [Planctomycetota bacterium]